MSDQPAVPPVQDYPAHWPELPPWMKKGTLTVKGAGVGSEFNWLCLQEQPSRYVRWQPNDAPGDGHLSAVRLTLVEWMQLAKFVRAWINAGRRQA